MQLRDTTEEAAFRAELRAWLEEHNPGLEELPDTEAKKAWSRKIYDAGYAGLTWPKEYGGQGASYSHQAIMLEEWARAEAPSHAGSDRPRHGRADDHRPRDGGAETALPREHPLRRGDLVPGLLGAGRWIRPLRRADERRARERALRRERPEGLVVVRSPGRLVHPRRPVPIPSSERHAGLTYLVVDMHSPGVEVRPIRHITGDADFNEIFFENVEVPVENVLGEIGDGWAVAMTTLLHERGTLGFALTGTLEVSVRKLLALSKERSLEDSRLRDLVAREWIELQALKLTNYRALTKLVETGIPGPEGSVSKLHWSEQNQRLTKLALEIEDGEDGDGWWRYQQLRSRGNTIEAGTSEILRNIIAERVLGLPRSR